MRILLFLLLKTIEILLFIFIPYLVGGLKILDDVFVIYCKDSKLERWGRGWIFLCTTLAIFFMVGVILISNWKMAGIILGLE